MRVRAYLPSDILSSNIVRLRAKLEVYLLTLLFLSANMSHGVTNSS